MSALFSFNLRFDVTKARTKIRTLPARLATRLSRALKVFGAQYIQRIKTERLSGRPGLARRTGELSRHFRAEVFGDTLANLGLKIYNALPYAKIHEYGGRIVPKKGQWLTIPLDAVKTGAGVARGGARDYENTFVITSKRGNKLIMQRKGNGEVVPLFLLRKEVTIPPRLGARQLLKDMMREKRTWLTQVVTDVRTEKAG